MRACSARLLLAVLILTGGFKIVAAEPASVREIDKLQFAGVSAADESEIRASLKQDFDLLLAAHPDAPLTRFLRAIETTTLLGYRHSGFRDAEAQAEYDEQQQTIVVRVSEGQQYLCGEITVTGGKQVNADAIRNALAEPEKPAGRPWIKDRKAPFDEPTSRLIRLRLTNLFGAQGFFSPAFDIDIVADAATKTAELRITIHSEGPRAEIGRITIAGNERDTDDEILKYLNLRSGQTFDNRLVDRLNDLLKESGRFLGSKIDASKPETCEDGRVITNLTLALRDFESAPPLVGEFSAEQNAALSIRGWLNRWSRGDAPEDIVCEVSFGADDIERMCDEMDLPMMEPKGLGIHHGKLRAILAPRKGQLFALQLFAADGRVLLDEVLVSSPDRLTLAAPQRHAKLEIPLHETQLTFTWNGDAAKYDDLDKDKHERQFRFMLGATVNINGKHEATPLTVKAKAAPTALLHALTDTAAKYTLNNGVWHIDGENFDAKIDAASGRLLRCGLRVLDNTNAESSVGHIQIRTQAGAFEEASSSLDSQLSVATAYDSQSPWKSVLEFALDEILFLQTAHTSEPENADSWRALRKLVGRSRVPAFEELRAGAFSYDNDGPGAFSMPMEIWHFDFSELGTPGSSSRKSLLAMTLPIYSRLIGHDNWLWSLGRDFAMAFGMKAEVASESMTRQVTSTDLGPLRAATFASMNLRPLAAIAAQNGIPNLTLDAFRRDYQPLLAGDSWLSRFVLSLAEAARSLDEAELRSLAAFAGEDSISEPLATLLLLLKEQPEKPVAEAVSRMFDVLWNVGLRDMISKRLRKIAAESHVHNPPIRWSQLSAKEASDKLDALTQIRNKPKEYESPKPQFPGAAGNSLENKMKDWDRFVEDLQKNGTMAAAKNLSDDRLKILQPTASALPAAEFPPPHAISR